MSRCARSRTDLDTRRSVQSLLTNVIRLLTIGIVAACGSASDPTPTPSGQTPAIGLSLGQTTASLQQGGASQVTVSVTRSGGFTGSVSFTVQGVPTGVTASVTNPQTTGTTTTATLDIAVGTTAAAGTSTITVRASGSGVTDASVSFALTVTAAPAQGFTLALQPTSLSVAAGSATSSTLTISRTGGFTGAVTLTVSGAPAGMTASVTPSPTTANTATVNITTTAATAAQAYSLTVTGAGFGVANQSITLPTTVTAAPGGTGNVTLDYSACAADFVILWFGYQDGTGPWTQVTPTGRVYRFNVSSATAAYALTTTTAGSNVRSTSVFFNTRAEMTAAPVISCATTTGTNTLSGTAAGLGQTDIATISIGNGAGVAIGTTAAFQISSVLTGISDLVGYKIDALGSSAPDRGFVRRDVNVTGNISVGTVDFNGSESFAPATAALTIAGSQAGEQFGAGMSYLTGTACRVSSLYSRVATSPTSVPMFGFPAANQRTTDYHMVSASASSSFSGAGTSRIIQEVFHTLANRTLTLPPFLPTPTVTTLTGPYKRFQVSLTLPSAYNTTGFSYSDQNAQRSIAVSATPLFLAGSATSTLAVPDLSVATGWDNAWAPATTATGLLIVSGSGGTFTGSSVCQENGRLVGATARQTF